MASLCFCFLTTLLGQDKEHDLMKFSGTHVAALPREKSVMVCGLCIGLSERHCSEIVVSMWGACARQKQENKVISPRNNQVQKM